MKADKPTVGQAVMEIEGLVNEEVPSWQRWRHIPCRPVAPVNSSDREQAEEKSDG